MMITVIIRAITIIIVIIIIIIIIILISSFKKSLPVCVKLRAILASGVFPKVVPAEIQDGLLLEVSLLLRVHQST